MRRAATKYGSLRSTLEAITTVLSNPPRTCFPVGVPVSGPQIHPNPNPSLRPSPRPRPSKALQTSRLPHGGSIWQSRLGYPNLDADVAELALGNLLLLAAVCGGRLV